MKSLSFISLVTTRSRCKTYYYLVLVCVCPIGVSGVGWLGPEQSGEHGENLDGLSLPPSGAQALLEIPPTRQPPQFQFHSSPPDNARSAKSVNLFVNLVLQ